MKQNNIIWILIVLLACAGIGFGAYSLGQDRVKQEMQAERDLNILLNRAELETLKLVDGPIYVFGHKSPDSDTVCTSIVYAKILQQLGYDAQPAVQGNINNETAYILKMAGVAVPDQILDTVGKNVVLIDHSELIQSAEDLKDANIITIIDHHNNGSVTTNDRLIYDSRPVGSAATIAWIRARNYGVEIDATMAALMFGNKCSF